MSDPVEQAERDLEQAKLSQEYDKAVEAYRDHPTDAKRAKKDELAAQLVSVRQASRLKREADADSLTDGQARPGSVRGSGEAK